MSVLALDPATRTGFALLRDDGEIESGTWNLKPDKFQCEGVLYLNLHKKLIQLFSAHKVKYVVYEDVKNHNGTQAAHMYGGLKAIILSECENYGIEYYGLGVGAIKSHATGKGNSQKDAMISAARRRWPDINILDDNQADALWILDLFCKTHGIPQATPA